MKKLMFFVLSLKMGGSEMAAVRLASILCRDYKVSVCTLFGGGELKAELDGSVEVKSVFPRFIRGISRLVDKLPPAAAYRFCVRGEYDAEIAVGDGLEAHIISGSPNPEKFCWIHMNMLYHGIENCRRAQERYHAFKKIICVSETAAVGFSQKFGFNEKLRIAYTPTDSDMILKKAAQAEPDEKNYFVAVGRLEAVKGFDKLIDAFSKLSDKECKLYIMGKGTQKEALQSRIDALKLQDRVFLSGLVLNPYPYIKGARALICSSENESFGFTIIEAMILSAPVISVRCGGAEEIINSPDVGLLCENSTEGLAAALQTFAGGEYFPDIKKAKQRALDFSAERCSGAFIDILKED